jgi:hypothetical protein
MEGDGIDAVSPATPWTLTTPVPTAPGKEGSSSKFRINGNETMLIRK